MNELTGKEYKIFTASILNLLLSLIEFNFVNLILSSPNALKSLLLNFLDVIFLSNLLL